MTQSTQPDALPRIQKFQSLGFGLFLHWGLYSIPGAGEWAFKISNWNRMNYRALAEQFTAKEFDAEAIARFARRCGVRYIVLTTRHHDGFSLYNTRGLSDFDSVQTAAGRDLVAEFVDGCRKADIVPFFYHTTLDWMWHNELTENLNHPEFRDYLEYLRASVEILCRDYGPVGGFWFDGNWSRPDSDWQEDRLYQTIRKHQPEAIIVNNTGLFARGATGHPEIDCLTYEQGLPSPPDQTGWPKYLAGEMCETMNKHWGWSRNDFHHMSVPDMIRNYSRCRKVGMNYLLNIGPEPSGKLPALEKAMLNQFGDWFGCHGKPLTTACPGMISCDHESVFIVETDDAVYGAVEGLGISGNAAVTVDNGQNRIIMLSNLSGPIKNAHWLDNQEPIKTEPVSEKALRMHLTPNPYGCDYIVRVFRAEITDQTITAGDRRRK